MRFIGGVIEKLQRHPKRIVFPEGAEPRVLQAARQFYSLRLGAPILLGDRTKVKEVAEALNISTEGIRIINPEESDDLENFARRFEALRRYKGLKALEAREAMLQPNYFGAMMVAMHQADGFVSGTNQITGSVLRPLFQIIKVAPKPWRPPVARSWKSKTRASARTGFFSWAIAASFPIPQLTSSPISRFPRHNSPGN